jgi:hypothetical protein
MAVLFPEPAGPVRNIRSWSLPPLAFNFLIVSLPSVVEVISMICCKYTPNFVFLSHPSFTNPRRNVQAIISYAIYCFSSSCVYSNFATFCAIFGNIWYFLSIVVLVLVFVIICNMTVCRGIVFVFIGVNI